MEENIQMPEWPINIGQTKDKSAFLDHHGTNEVWIANIGEGDRNPRPQFQGFDRLDQSLEILSGHLHGNIHVECDPFDTMKNTGDATAEHEFHAAICQRQKYFFEMVLH